ncbi:MAG: glycosyltransferase family 2 protein [Nakamurella sp.]
MTSTLHLQELPGNGATAEADISVVICGYTMERWADICAAVDSAIGQRPAPREVLFVVDYNEELRLAALARFVGPFYAAVSVVANEEEKGLSGARNTGVRLATSEVVAFLDDDAAAEDGWIEAMVGHYLDPSVFGVGGFAEPVWPADRPSWLPVEFDWVVGCSYVGQPEEVAPVRNFIGCNMSLRRAAFEMVGGFSSAVGRVGKTPLGCEETELCIRLVQHNPDATLIYDPDMRVAHHVSADRTRRKYFVRRCYNEGLSKAIVAQLVGTVDGLGSERSYATKTLPLGVLRSLAQLIRPTASAGGRRGAAQRAMMIVVGLFVTAVGYSTGRARLVLGRQRVSAAPAVAIAAVATPAGASLRKKTA